MTLTWHIKLAWSSYVQQYIRTYIAYSEIAISKITASCIILLDIHHHQLQALHLSIACSMFLFIYILVIS